MSAAKPRVRVLADGRIGFPGVVEYVLTAGPNAGKALLAPPTVSEHGDPTSAVMPALASRFSAKQIAEGLPGGWDGRPLAECFEASPRETYPFTVVVHDVTRYEELRASGLIYDPRHTGRAGGIVDNRRAPGT